MDPQLSGIIATGQEAIDGFMPSSGRLAATLASEFPAVSLEAIAAEFAKAPEPKNLNAKVTKLGALVREEAAVASTLFSNAEMWLHCKTPSVSDGNNFGVDVQQYVLSELAKMRKEMDGMNVVAKDYHWGRASGLEKLVADEKADKSTTETTEVDADGKSTTKKSSVASLKSVTTSTASADYKEYLVAVDVKQYHTCFTQLSEIRNSYLRAHLLFAKNLKRLTDPRGEGEDGRSGNVMSMF